MKFGDANLRNSFACNKGGVSCWRQKPKEERESECSAKEDQPPAPRVSVALGSLAKSALEKVSSRKEEADEGK